MPWVRTRRRRRRCLLSLCIHTPRTIGKFVKKHHHSNGNSTAIISVFICARMWKKCGASVVEKRNTFCVKKGSIASQAFFVHWSVHFFCWLCTRIRTTSSKLLCSILETRSLKIFDLLSQKGAESLCFVKMPKKTSEIRSSSAVKVDFVTKIALTINILDSKILVLNRF